MPADPAQFRSAALFDQADSHASRPRRRPAPDWGGDELFDRVPRRRFARTGEERRRSGPEPVARREPLADPRLDEAAPFAEAPGAPVAAPRPHPVEELVLARRSEYETMSPPPEGRRTVTVTGRPGHHLAVRPSRPSRSVEQRMVARPDQVAAWAFALGLLLIVVAIATAG